MSTQTTTTPATTTPGQILTRIEATADEERNNDALLRARIVEILDSREEQTGERPCFYLGLNEEYGRYALIMTDPAPDYPREDDEVYLCYSFGTRHYHRKFEGTDSCVVCLNRQRAAEKQVEQLREAIESQRKVWALLHEIDCDVAAEKLGVQLEDIGEIVATTSCDIEVSDYTLYRLLRKWGVHTVAGGEG